MIDIDALIERLCDPLHSISYEDRQDAADAIAKLRERDKYCDDAFRYYEDSLDEADAEIARLKELVDPDLWDWDLRDREQKAEIAKLREALQTIVDGIPVVRAKPYRDDGMPSKCDKCPHDQFIYEGCEECVSDFARSALGEKPPRAGHIT